MASSSSGKVTKPSASKPKQPWQVEKQATKRNWLDLPSDVMENILSRVGVFDILQKAQKVCTTWHQICKEPAVWRVVSMDNPPDACGLIACRNICRHVVFRSQGQMVDLSIGGFSDGKLLEYIADRSTQLRRLEVIYCFGGMYGAWGESLKKLSFLEELSLFETGISDKEIEEAGRYCPLLKALKVNIKPYVYCDDHVNDEKYMSERNALAVAIGKSLPELRHLELIGNSMTDTGLKAILDGCRLLESLDLRQCFYIDFKGDLGKRCSEQIKHLKLPDDSLVGFKYYEENVDEPCDVTSESEIYFDGYDGPFYHGFNNDDSDDDYDEDDHLEDLLLCHEAMAFMAMFK